MAITDPTALAFTNEKIRPLANTLARLYYHGKSIIDEYDTRGGINFIPNSPSETVEDGADADSRPVISGEDVTRIGAVMVNFIDLLEANGGEKLAHINAVANRATVPFSDGFQS